MSERARLSEVSSTARQCHGKLSKTTSRYAVAPTTRYELGERSPWDFH